MKRIVSLLIVVLLLFSAMTTVFADDITTGEPLYNKHFFNIASGLTYNLVGENVFGDNPNKFVTRAEFVYGIVKIFNIPIYKNEKQTYDDILPDNKYYDAIMSANIYGWISDNDKFNPDQYITYNEAIKITLCASGYESIANINGGYPFGYLELAAKINLNKGIQLSKDGKICAANAVIMGYNILMADAFEMTGYGDSLAFSIGRKSNMELIYDVYKIEGIVTTVGNSSIILEHPLRQMQNFIEIDGIGYKSTNIDKSYLGMNVEAYCKKDTGVKEILCATICNNETIEFVADNFDSIKDGKLQYFNNGKIRSIKLDSGYKLIYNGRRVVEFEDYMIDDFGATIKLIDNNNDSVFDLITIDGYTYGKITSVDFVNGSIGVEMIGKRKNLQNIYKYEKYSKVLDFSDDTRNEYFIKDIRGTNLEIFELKNDSIIAVKESADSAICEIVICDNTVSGKVKQIDIATNKIILDDTEYNFSDGFKGNYIDKKIINVGSEIDVTIGMHGELVCVSSNITSMEYGFLLDVHNDTENLNNSVQVKIYTLAGKFEIFNLAKKITIDGGISKFGKSESFSILSGRKQSAIRYQLNALGELRYIDFAEAPDENASYNTVINPKNNLIIYHSQSDGNLKYRSSCKGFNSYALLNNATIMFIPELESDREDEDKFFIGGYSQLVSNYAYKCEIFDIDENGMTPFVIIYSDNEVYANPEYVTCIVEKVREAVNNDEIGYQIYCWINGEYKDFFMPEDIVVTKSLSPATIQSGDIVRLRCIDNRIKNIYVDYYLDANKEMIWNNSPNGSNNDRLCDSALRYVQGKLYSISSDSNVLSSGDKRNGVTYDFSYKNLKTYTTPTYICCYDTETGKVRPINYDNIRTFIGYEQNADYVILRESIASSKVMFVIR